MRTLASLAVLLLACSPSSDAAGGGRTTSGAREAAPDLAVGLPADAALVLTTPAWSEVRARAPRSAWVQLFGGETWRDLRRFVQALTRAGEPEGVDLLGALAATDGLAAALTFHGPELQPGVTVLVRAGGDAAPLLGLGEWVMAQATRGDDLAERAHEGARLRVHVGAYDTQVLFQDGDLLGLTAGPTEDVALALATGALDRLRGRSAPPGGGSSALAEAFADGSPDQVLRVFADGPRWLGLLDRFGGEGERAIVGELGLREVPWGTLEVTLGEGQALGARLAFRVPAGTALGEFLAALRPAPLDLLDTVPDSAVLAVVGGLDPRAAFGTFERFLEAHHPRNHEGLQRDLQHLTEDFGLDLRRDVLASWDGGFALFGTPPAPAAMLELGRAPFAGALPLVELGGWVRLADPAPLARAVRTAVAGAWEGEVPSISVGGCEAWSFAPEGPVRPLWAVHGERLLFAQGDAPMRSLMERCTGVDDASVLSRAGLRDELRAHADASLVSLVPVRHMAQAMCGLLRSLGFAGYESWRPAHRMLADLRLPAVGRIEELFHGHVVQALRRSGDLLELSLTIR